jgi:hypothetical protein
VIAANLMDGGEQFLTPSMFAIANVIKSVQ